MHGDRVLWGRPAAGLAATPTWWPAPPHPPGDGILWGWGPPAPSPGGGVCECHEGRNQVTALSPALRSMLGDMFVDGQFDGFSLDSNCQA